MDIVEEVRKHVVKRYEDKGDVDGVNMYEIHVKYVVEYAKELAKKLGASVEIVEIASLLHDIARIDGRNENHHIDGAKYAEEYLNSLGYDPKKIDIVKDCIYSHRGSTGIPQKTLEAKCLASADAMSHFKSIPDMFYLVYKVFGYDIKEGKQRVKKKLTESYNKMIPEAQEMVKEKYLAVLKILE